MTSQLVNEVKNEVNKNIMLQINQILHDDGIVEFDIFRKMNIEIEKDYI